MKYLVHFREMYLNEDRTHPYTLLLGFIINVNILVIFDLVNNLYHLESNFIDKVIILLLYQGSIELATKLKTLKYYEKI